MTSAVHNGITNGHGHHVLQDGCELELANQHELKLPNATNDLYTPCSSSITKITDVNRNIYGINETTRPIYDSDADANRFRYIRSARVVPPTLWTPSCHPQVEHVSLEVNKWFLDNWPFPHDRARQKFVDAGFSWVTCLYYPLAKDDRIHFACRLLTILFLIDDLLESMSLEDGKKYNDNLMPLARGDVLPNRDVPVEYMFYDLWHDMRCHDEELANEILEPTFVFMRAQTDKVRKQMTDFGQYLEYREGDVGKALLSALMRFVMDLHLSADELQEMKPVEQNCSKHISIVNDIYSWEKELKQSQDTAEEGSHLCTGVQILSSCAGLDIPATKACLWTMVREWEVKHEILCSAPHLSANISKSSLLYLKGLEYQMSGNELWSRMTPRYLVVE